MILFEFHGVRYEADQDAWVAEVQVGERIVFRGDYSVSELAAVGREIAILTGRWEVVRNFPTEDLGKLCKRFAEGIEYDLISPSSGWPAWVMNLGLAPERFLELAGVDAPLADA